VLTLIAILLLLAIFGCAIAVLDHWVWADRSVEWRFAEGYPEHLPALAADLVRAKVDIILAENPQAIRPVQEANSTIPIIMAISTDPVGTGIIAKLAHPGGNITGRQPTVTPFADFGTDHACRSLRVACYPAKQKAAPPRSQPLSPLGAGIKSRGPQ